MPKFLILKLDGPMQAWGTHTFEDFRPSNGFPTRSGLLGLIGACLGIERRDREAMERLSNSLEFTVRVDTQAFRQDSEQPLPKPALKLPDFHTVLDARKVDGSVNKNPVVSRREYLYDAAFTVAIGERAEQPAYSLERIAEGLRRPLYTPVLGRRSCPLSRPLLDRDGFLREAQDACAALAEVPPGAGLIYTEDGTLGGDRPLSIRDVPLHGRHRQFGNRRVYVHRSPASQGGKPPQES
jgi:CRISPR system Cascade subunit CasD